MERSTTFGDYSTQKWPTKQPICSRIYSNRILFVQVANKAATHKRHNSLWVNVISVLLGHHAMLLPLFGNHSQSNLNHALILNGVPQSNTTELTNACQAIFKRMLVYLDGKETKVPTGKRLEELKASNWVEEISLTRNHSASAIDRLLLASFPSLLGVDLERWTFVFL